MNVLISGAGVAGPALAYWLRHYGFTPTVVERAPALRTGGHAVDFRGRAHLSVLDKMGVPNEVMRQQTGMGAMSYEQAMRLMPYLPGKQMAANSSRRTAEAITLKPYGLSLR